MYGQPLNDGHQTTNMQFLNMCHLTLTVAFLKITLFLMLITQFAWSYGRNFNILIAVVSTRHLHGMTLQ